MLNITDKYLEDEIRDGFYIPSMTKRTWAMELTVLDLIDSICTKHGIKYYADWGTYLGAVRHGGFVPWDDDLDICMHRNEFEKFAEASKTEFPKGYQIITFKNNDYSWKFIANVAPNDHMCFEPEYLKTHYSFPYIVGIDIFIIDNIADDEELEDERREKTKKLLGIADTIDSLVKSQDDFYKKISDFDNQLILNSALFFTSLTGINVDRNTRLIELKRLIYSEAEKLLKIENMHDTANIVQKIPWGIYNKKTFPREYYDEFIRIPFETTTVPVPICYDRGLRNKYGNFMKLVMGGGGHNYPYYISQKKSLSEEFDYPAVYKFNIDDLKDTEKDFSGSLKQIASEIKNYLVESAGIIDGILCGLTEGSCEYTNDEINGFLADCQDNAVSFGGLVEKVKGENTETVSHLEKYCELLFNISNHIAEVKASSNLAEKTDNGSLKTHALSDELKRCVNDINSVIDKEIINRHTVVFLPVKAEYFNSLAHILEEEVKNADTDIYIVTLPYMYKEYSGAFKDEINCESTEIRDIVEQTMRLASSLEENNTTADGDDVASIKHVYFLNYNELDLPLFCPDKIYINNPYDEYNMAISVPQYFYSRNLRKYTSELIYVQFFKSMEFDRDNYPCVYNMQYFCTVPGVVLADKVLVQSENIRQRYIEKLTEWSGQGIWDEKICVITALFPRYEIKQKESQLIKNQLSDSGDDKKVIVWHVNVGTLIEYEDAYFDKLYKNLDTFTSSRESLYVILTSDSNAEDVLKTHRSQLFDKWADFLETFKSRKIGLYANESGQMVSQQNLSEIADAYYGNPSSICKDFIISKKPVMIQNVEI